ncbi:MAG: FIST C-terminal domain-containing protein [Candidatus Roizmanbacteria bacterium]|nr:FIST C-terminal domain-containing protein [Candidatus Roizmanbacteria bacterium]
MKTEQKKWTQGGGWQILSDNHLKDVAQLVFMFGDTDMLKDPSHFQIVRDWYPQAHIVSGSTAGEIIGTEVLDGSMVVTAVRFDMTTIQVSKTKIDTMEDSLLAGKRLADSLAKDGLVHVLVFSDGLHVNGTNLSRGLSDNLPKNVAVTGGLVGDQARFKETVVGLDSAPEQNTIVVVGLYGTGIKIGYGSLGGWDPFGPERLVTKSKGNVLYELDGQSALALYKQYLGDQAKGLPASGLLFPLSMRLDGKSVVLVRTILAVNEQDQSMTFAGDIPEGSYVRLMKANFERLIDGASGAASMSHEALGQTPADLALLISCVGRKLVLKQRIEEEIENVQNKLGKTTVLTGFYSYGEICPVTPTERQCELHNQTMTITTFAEG